MHVTMKMLKYLMGALPEAHHLVENTRKTVVVVQWLSHVSLFVTPWTAAY